MKLAVLFFLLVMWQVHDNSPTGNPAYDFPEKIIFRNGSAYGHINANMNALSVSGYFREGLKYEDSLLGLPSPQYITLKNDEVIAAREFILREAKKYRILLINESHNHPEHRLFTKSLLKDLFDQGYNVFMAEGIKFHSGLDQRGYPINEDGYYLSEPVYASMIRYAKRIGYKVSAYEFYSEKKEWDDSIRLDTFGSMKYIGYEPKDSAIIRFDKNGPVEYIMTTVREDGQAANIYNVIKQNPSSKFIIHVGNGHLAEDGPMMGAKLKELLGNEDLLTIDQVALSIRKAIIDTLTNDTIRRSFAYILKNRDTKKIFHYYNGAQVDYTIFNAVITDSMLRPDFLFRDVEKRIVYNIKADQLEDCPCMFSAYYTSELEKEKNKAIAVDVLYIKNKTFNAPLLLYKGSYTILKKNKTGKIQSFQAEGIK
ncbi:hypothetical protein [Chitinophaga polysaccharea]|uniref:hypothetical protein n=1 Tax=Chitinophaga polysaccharea TaxID=1293035 RepID=UPI001159BDA1|nr:hypothetical protein [Chitinophaga polysaccharea]